MPPGRWILNHWTTREILSLFLVFVYLVVPGLSRGVCDTVPPPEMEPRLGSTES